MSEEPMIQVSGLLKSYGDAEHRQTVIKGLDFQVQQGECIALLGQSGSGKSTLLNLLAGIDQPDQGKISILGQAVSDWRERERTLFRRRNIGFVYQFFNLIPTLTVAENVQLPMELNRVEADFMKQRVLGLLKDLGLEDKSGDYPENLSGGEQQRVAIARALAHDPQLLLADEPTGNLDATTGRGVLDLLLKLTRDAGHTLLVVTHSQAVAAAADRTLVLEEGRLHDGGAALAW